MRLGIGSAWISSVSASSRPIAPWAELLPRLPLQRGVSRTGAGAIERGHKGLGRGPKVGTRLVFINLL